MKYLCPECRLPFRSALARAAHEIATHAKTRPETAEQRKARMSREFASLRAATLAAARKP